MEQLSFDDLEAWKPIPGYEGFYDASSLGRIRSLPRSFRKSVVRVLKPWTKPDGHLMVALSADGRHKSHDVHRLVALTFLGPPPSPDHEVCHNDGDPANNALGNLRWGTRGDNVRDSVRHGTNTWSSRERCPQDHPYDEENTVIGRRGNGSTFRVCRICSREAKRRYEERRRKAALREM